MLDKTKCDKCRSAITASDLNNNSSNGGAVMSATLTNQCVFQIHLLDSQVLEVTTNIKSTIGELFQKVASHIDLKDEDIFGLAKKTNNEFLFISNDTKISKLYDFPKRMTHPTQTTVSMSSVSSLPMSSSNGLYSSMTASQQNVCTSQTNFASKILNNLNVNLFHHFGSYKINQIQQNELHGRNATCNCSLTADLNLKLYLRIKFYVNDPLLLGNSQTRHLYYMQLRSNFLTINNKLNDEKYFQIASLALVAEFGPFNSTKHVQKYFDASLYFPHWLIKKLGEQFIYDNMPRLHAQESRLTREKALNRFCVELSGDDCPFNVHLHTVSKHKDELPGSICLGVSPSGLLVFEMRHAAEINLISTFHWCSVIKLNADKRKFEIHINNSSLIRKYTYYTASEKFSKYLLELSRQTHAFTADVFSRLAGQKKLANYVTESYSDRLLGFNDGTTDETYQEREIKTDDSPVRVHHHNYYQLSSDLDELKLTDSSANSTSNTTTSGSGTSESSTHASVSLQENSSSFSNGCCSRQHLNTASVAAAVPVGLTQEEEDMSIYTGNCVDLKSLKDSFPSPFLEASTKINPAVSSKNSQQQFVVEDDADDMYELNCIRIDCNSQNNETASKNHHRFLNSTAIADQQAEDNDESDNYERLDDSSAYLTRCLVRYDLSSSVVGEQQMLRKPEESVNTSSLSPVSSSSDSSSLMMEKKLSNQLGHQFPTTTNMINSTANEHHITKFSKIESVPCLFDETSVADIFKTRNNKSNTNGYIDMSEDSLNVVDSTATAASYHQAASTPTTAVNNMSTSGQMLHHLDYRQTFSGKSSSSASASAKSSGCYNSRSFMPPPPPLPTANTNSYYTVDDLSQENQNEDELPPPPPNEFQSCFLSEFQQQQQQRASFRLNDSAECTRILQHQHQQQHRRRTLNSDLSQTDSDLNDCGNEDSRQELKRASVCVRNEFSMLANSFGSMFNKSTVLGGSGRYDEEFKFVESGDKYIEDSAVFDSTSPYVNIKYKKPPSYEESLRKFKKHSLNSSSFSSASTANEADEESPAAKFATTVAETSDFNNNSNRGFEHDDSTNPALFDDDGVDSPNQDEESEAVKDKENSGCNEQSQRVVDNTIALSAEGLEEIRAKAASMSLPLLTALCSDRALFRNLNHSNKSKLDVNV